MNSTRTWSGLGLVALLLALSATPPALATNGMYLVGYGPETVGRGGANLAISDRSLAINFNPAGISQLQGNHFSAALSVLAPDMDYSNLINSETDANSNLFPLPAFAYVRSGKETPWSWGLGFVAQGGMGAEYDTLNTFFGTQDSISSEVRFMTFVPTVAYAINDDLSLGMAVNIGYADASFSLFPETSFFNMAAPDFSFFGVDMSRAGGLQTNARLGVWWRPHPQFSVGAIYQTKTNSSYENGDMTVNFSQHPFLQQKVDYDATMEGFTFAAQAGIGFAFRPNDRWQLALDIKRYYWDDAIDTIQVKATNPSVAGAPEEVVLPFVFDWKDQWVFAFGGDFRASDKLTLRAGYNYGENPVPDDTLTPLFPAIVEKHVTVGASWYQGKNTWEIAVERAFENSQTNNNPNPMVNPFGPASTVKHSQWTVSFGFSTAWSRK